MSGNKLNIAKEEAFCYPTNASDLGIFKVDNSINKSQVEKFSLSEVQSKMVLLDIYDDDDENKLTYVIPFLHT